MKGGRNEGRGERRKKGGGRRGKARGKENKSKLRHSLVGMTNQHAHV